VIRFVYLRQKALFLLVARIVRKEIFNKPQIIWNHEITGTNFYPRMMPTVLKDLPKYTNESLSLQHIINAHKTVSVYSWVALLTTVRPNCYKQTQKKTASECGTSSTALTVRSTFWNGKFHDQLAAYKLVKYPAPL